MVHSTRNHISKDLYPLYDRTRVMYFSLSFGISFSHVVTIIADRWLNLCSVQSTCYHVLLIWLRRWTRATHIKIHCHTILCGVIIISIMCVRVCAVSFVCAFYSPKHHVNDYWSWVHGFAKRVERAYVQISWGLSLV